VTPHEAQKDEWKHVVMKKLGIQGDLGNICISINWL